ncbi:MAG: hypothetical protein EPN21_19585 [Methylococcaceae bacterium]|nr:MAG: hypothetical protein EPN21_19585 [Methylococcaceae bacterium]
MKKLINEIWRYIYFTLVFIGVTGLAWRAFGENGWIQALLGAAWDASLRTPILAIPVVGGAVLLVILFVQGGLRPGKPGKTGLLDDLLIYALMAYGVYITYQWLMIKVE